MKAGNKLSSVQQIQASTTGLREFVKTMTFVVPLSPAERRVHRVARLGPQKMRQLENRLEAARLHRELLPGGFDLKGFERDAEETIALGECLKAIDEIYEAVNDTILAVGKRAAVAGTTAYGYLRVGSKTAEDLKRTVQKIAGRRVSIPVTESSPAVVPLPGTAAEKPSEGTSQTDASDKAA